MPGSPRRIVKGRSHLGWHRYYVNRFNKTEHPDAALLVMFYLFLALREGEIE